MKTFVNMFRDNVYSQAVNLYEWTVQLYQISVLHLSWSIFDIKTYRPQ